MRMRNSKSQRLEKDILCNVCEMVAFWIQVEIRKERSKDLAFQYVNQVRFFFSSVAISVIFELFLVS